MDAVSKEIFVGPDSLIEIQRGEKMTVVQVFGEDWSTPPNVTLHQQAVMPPKPAEPEPAAIMRQLDPEPRYNTGFLVVVMLLTGLCAWLIMQAK